MFAATFLLVATANLATQGTTRGIATPEADSAPPLVTTAVATQPKTPPGPAPASGAPASAAPRLDPRQQAEQARTEFTAGTQAHGQGDYTTARTHFARAFELLPDWSLAALNFGVTAALVNPDDPAALDALERAVALDPNNPRARYYLGLALEHRQRWEQAAQQYETAMAARPSLYDVRFRLATVYRELHRLDDALTNFRAVLATDARHLGALTATAEIYELKEDFRAAELALLTIVGLLPNVAYHRYRLAAFYGRTGATTKAEQVLLELELRDPRQRKMRRLR